MSKTMSSVHRVENRRLGRGFGKRALGLCLAGGLLPAAPAHALQLYDGTNSGNNWEVSLDTTLSYTGMYRVGAPSAILADGTLNGEANINGNDGDANFRHGLVTNLFEILPVLDIKNNDFGAHFSGEYFVNTVYLQHNQNNQPDYTLNSFTSCQTCFSPATAEAEGHNGRMLDAFVYNSWHFGNDQEFTLKAGQQTLFWGQSLFFGTDGIAEGQTTIDTVSAQNVVNAQTQQIDLPVGQLVVTYKPDLTYTLQGFYQYQWQPYSLQGVGAFFSSSDLTGPGSDKFIPPGFATLLPSGFYLPKLKALTPPSQNGQFGLSLQAQYGNYDVGLFGMRYDQKTPEIKFSAKGFQYLYPRDIEIYGASLGTTVGATQIGSELSLHTHTPLVGNGEVLSGDANANPGYPVGDALVGLVNFIYGSPSLPFDPGGVTLVGELCYTDTYRVTANPQDLQPGRSKMSLSFGGEAIPTYNEVLPFLQLSFPFGLIGYTVAGNSQFDGTLNHGAATEADIGISATYRSVWTASLTYIAPFGKVTTNPQLPESGSGTVDRKYIQLNIQRTF